MEIFEDSYQNRRTWAEAQEFPGWRSGLPLGIVMVRLGASQ